MTTRAIDLEKMVEEEIFQKISEELRYWPRMTSPLKEDRVQYLKQIMEEIESVGGKDDFLRMVSRHLKREGCVSPEIQEDRTLSF